MNDSQRAVFARLTEEFSVLSQQVARMSALLSQVEVLAQVEAPGTFPVQTPPPDPVPIPVQTRQPNWSQMQPPPAYLPPRYAPPPMHVPQRQVPMYPPQVRVAKTKEPGQSWIGKALAVAGVIVTLVGVVLLLVLAAQAGILRPETRVAGGVALSAALVGLAFRLQSRTGGRVGAIALGATGIAAGYMNVIAVSTIYQWVPAPAALFIAALVGGGGLMLARRWDSQHLAVLVLVPLAVLAPVITDGVTVLLIGFMLALSASSLPVQFGRDWIWMHAARVSAATLPLLAGLVGAEFGSRANPWLLGSACGLGALLAIVGALLLLPSASNKAAVALVSSAGLIPVLLMKAAVDHWFAALLAAALSACLLTLALAGSRLPGGERVVTQIWSAISAVAALVAVTAAFQGAVAAPVLLAMGIVVAIAARRDNVARWSAVGLGGVGALMYLGVTPPDVLTTATVMPIGAAVSALVASLLAAGWAAVVVWSWVGVETDESGARMLWIASGVVIMYGITAFTVIAGVLIGGANGGFLAGHMAATICWIGLAAVLFGYALRVGGRDRQAAPIAGGLVLTTAAMVKLFLFDLGTLDGIFRVVAFIVAGLILLAMGAGYARSLAVQAVREPADTDRD